MKALRKAILAISITGIALTISPFALANGPSVGLDEPLNPQPQKQEQTQDKTKNEKSDQPEKETIKSAQRVLREKGLFLGFADGRMDSHTVRAVKEFQKQNDMKVTGKLDDNTLKALMNEPDKSIQAEEEAMER